MSLSIVYKPLFEVKILHHYFLDNGSSSFDDPSPDEPNENLPLYDVSSFLKIIPSETCFKILRNNHCVFQSRPTGFKVWIKTCKDDVGNISPFIDLADELKFTFHLFLTDICFLNYTALPMLYHQGKIYSFNNLSKPNGVIIKYYPYLSRYPSIFGGKTHYSSGDILVDQHLSPNIVYIAKKITDADPTSATTDWLQFTNLDNNSRLFQYASENDMIPICTGKFYSTSISGIFNYISDSKDPALVATIRNQAGDTMTDITPPKRLTNLTIANPDESGNEVTMLQFDMRGLPSDMYKIKLSDNSDEFEFYYSPEGYTDLFGLIEIHLKNEDDTDYNLVNNLVDSNDNVLKKNGKLMYPVFELRFKNRSTYWKYLGTNLSNEPVTAEPQPLTRYGVVPVSLVNDKTETKDDLPNPTAKMIKADFNDERTAYNIYSETYIH